VDSTSAGLTRPFSLEPMSELTRSSRGSRCRLAMSSWKYMRHCPMAALSAPTGASARLVAFRIRISPSDHRATWLRSSGGMPSRCEMTVTESG
jgi:hypothetical protein